jgi:hypothetical protein
MQIFLKRHKEISYHRANYVHFIRFVRRLLGLLPEGRAAFRDALQLEKAVSEKKWLLEQCG